MPAENRILKERLNDAIETGSVFHAYIFLSEHKDAAEIFAKDFIKAILTHSTMDDIRGDCAGDMTGRDSAIISKVDEDHHEDVIVIRNKGASTKIDQIRGMQTRIGVRPIGERHIVLIADGDDMGEAAQNALLKTLEEPPGNTVLIIISGNIESLLPTVRSRSIVCTVEEEEDESSEKMTEIAGSIIDLGAERAGYYRLKRAISPLGEDRGEVRRFIDRAEEMCRDRLFERDDNGVPLNREQTIAEIRALEEARNRLERGMSPKYIVKELLLKIGG